MILFLTEENGIFLKILHTSDWHLGHSLYGKTRAKEHQAFIEWLLALVEKEQIDLVIIAGDIFDTGTPPSYARQMYNEELILKMDDLDCQLLILAGNHDSVSMLSESACLLKKFNTHVITRATQDLDDQLIQVKDKNGEVGALICAVPFMRPRDIMYSVAGQGGADKDKALLKAMVEHYEQIFEKAKSMKQKLVETTPSLSSPLPIIATGHLTAIGSLKSDSMRDIYVGSLSAFSPEYFPKADYIALGHIHKPSRVGGQEHIRYSGSPIHLSFDELGYEKEVQIIEFTHSNKPSISSVVIPRFQYMASIKGDLDTLKKAFITISLEIEAHYPNQRAWVEVVVEHDDYLSDLNKYMEELIGDKPIDVLRIRRSRLQHNAMLATGEKQSLCELEPQDVFAKRLETESFDETTKSRLTQHFKQILSDVIHQNDQKHEMQDTSDDASKGSAL